jgi:antitoxin YefM
MTITKRGRPSAVVVSFDEFEALKETVEILSDPEAMRGIRRATRDIEAGRVRPWEEIRVRRHR